MGISKRLKRLLGVECDHEYELIEAIEGMGVYHRGRLIQQGGRFRCKRCGYTCLSGGTIVMSKEDLRRADSRRPR